MFASVTFTSRFILSGCDAGAVVMRVSLKNPSRCSRVCESRISSALYGSCSCTWISRRITLSEVLVLPLILMRSISTSWPGLITNTTLTRLFGPDQLRARIDVDVRVAAIRIEIRQRQHLPLQRRSAEQLPALHRQLLAQFAARKLQVAFDIDPADAVRRALVDRYHDRDFLAVADYLRRRNLHVQVAVVVVKGRQPIDVLLKFLRVERAPSGDPAQQLAVGSRLHVVLQNRRRKRVVAHELDLRDLDLRPFHHVEFAERRVVGLRDRLEGYLGVGVALVRVNRGDVVDRLLDRDRIEDCPRMHLHRRDYLVVVRADRLHPVELDVGNLRALLDVVHQHVLTALLHDVRAHVREESQPVNRLDVRIDRGSDRAAGRPAA